MTHAMESGTLCGYPDTHRGKCYSPEARQRRNERSRDYYRANREAVLEGQREYHRANAEHIAARYQRYRRVNPARAALRQVRGRAKEKGIPFTLTLETTPLIPAACPCCGVKLELGNGRATNTSPSLDRMVPELGYVPGNVHWLCNHCNTQKNDATLAELKRLVAFLESCDLEGSVS